MNGFNTFPINVQGHEDDYLLHLDGMNCPKFNQSLTQAWPGYESKAKTQFATFLARLGQLFGTGSSMEIRDALNACDYLSWAYYHDIGLTFDFSVVDVNSCNDLTNSYYNYVLDVDESLNYLAANQFLKKLSDSLSTLSGHMQFHETFFFNKFLLQSRREDHLSLEEVRAQLTADNGPRFFFYMTEQVYMRLLLSGIMGKQNRAQYPQVFQTPPKPSLQFAVEVIQNNDGTKSVAAHISDVDIVLGGCGSTKCDISAFNGYLKTVANIDVPAQCAGPKQSARSFYQ